MALIPQTTEQFVAERVLADDAKFWRHYLYFFELEFPAVNEGNVNLLGSIPTGKSSQIIFPLILAPQAMSMSEPFTTALSPVLGGNLYVEENGIIARTLRLQGTTGFMPRSFRQTAKLQLAEKISDTLTYDLRGKVPTAFTELSGQRHFHMLQDRVFRLYADLKRNPETSAGTRLYWHNIRDDEHWQVIPQNFSLIRSLPRRLTYNYDIQMIAVAPATARYVFFPPEDKNWFQKALDSINNLRNGVDQILGTLRNVAGLVKGIGDALQATANFISSSVEQLFNDIANVANACRSFLNGVTSLINLPATLLDNIINGVDTVANAIDELWTTATGLPDDVVKAYCDTGENFRKTMLGLFGVKVGGAENFRSNATIPTRRLNRPTTEREAAQQTSAQNLPAMGKRGTAPNPGDALIDNSRRGLAGIERAPAGARQQTVAANQSIEDVAQAALGDHTRWHEIAALNNLKAPYIHPAGLPGTVRPGDTILVPVSALPPSAPALPVILGVLPDAPNTERLFGVDWALAPSGSSGVYDLAISPQGSTDVDLVRGVDNLKQAIGTRVRTTRGDSGLFSQLGTDIVIGTGAAGVDREMAKIRIKRGVQADPRITNITGVVINETVTPDIVDVELVAGVYGLAEKITISTARDN